MFYYICEGELMTNAVSNLNIQPQPAPVQAVRSVSTPVAASNLTSPADFSLPKKNVVINPPQYFYKFSVRDAAHLDSEFSRNYMKTILESVHKHPVKKNKNSKQNWLLGSAIAGGGLALFCKRDSVATYLKRTVDILKTKIPYLQGKI